MPQSTTIVSLHGVPFAHPSFLQLHVVPLWQRTLRGAAFISEIWIEARALERKMTPRRLYD